MLRVVLYAEGAGETLGVDTMLPAPGSPLREEMLGSGHLLIRRAVESARAVPEAAMRFESPLRTRGRTAKGSDLRRKQTLRELLTWLTPSFEPDLVIVLVDSDGDPLRKTQLQNYALGLHVERIFAVAVQEFEAWLLADFALVGKVLGTKRSFAGPPEGLAPGRAKAELAEWVKVSAARSGRSVSDLRREIARECDLQVVRSACGSFAALLDDLRPSPAR